MSAMGSVGKAAELARGGELDRALKVLIDAQPRFAALLGDDSPAAITVLSGEADIYEAQNKPAEVERIYRRVADLRLASLGEKHPQTQAVLQQLIDLYNARERDRFDAGQWQAAGDSLTHAISAAGERFGSAAWQVHDLQIEAEFVRRFPTLSKDDRSRLRDAERKVHEATNLVRRSKFTDGLNCLSQALKIREQILGADHLRTATLRYDMGDLHLRLDDYRQAESLLQTALDAQEKALGRLHPTVAQTLTELGILYGRIGVRRKAIERFDEARQIYAATTGKQDRNYAWCVANLGMSYFQVRNLAKAEPLLQEALAVFEDLDDRQDFYANTLNNLAGVYEAMGRDDLAEELFHRAADIWHKTNDRLDYARSLDNRAAIELRRGEFTDAEKQMLEANAIFAADVGPDAPTTAKSCSNVSSLYYAWGKISQADKFVQQALSARHKNLEQMAAFQSQSGQIEFFTEFRTALDMYLTLSDKQHRSPEEVYREVLAWKGTVFLQQRQLQIASHRAELKPLSDKLHATSRQLAAAMFAAAPADDPDSWKLRLTALADEHARLERQIAAAAGLPPPEAVSVEKLTASLPAKAALVDVLEYGYIEPHKRDDRWTWQAERRLVAFILRPGRKLAQVDLGRSQPAVEAVDAWREACIDHRGYGVAAGAKLRDLVWTPLVKYLDGAQLILLAPDGPLTRVPFAALPGQKPDDELIDEVGIALIPSPQFLPELLAEPLVGIAKPQDSLLLMGDLNFAAPVGSKATTDVAQNPLAGQFPPLPGTQREIEAIQSLAHDHLPNSSLQLLRGDEATKGAFADASRHRTLHLATHGFFQPAQVRSAMDATGASGRGESFLDVPAAADWTDESQAVVLPPGAMCGLALSGAERPPNATGLARSTDTGILTAFEVAELDLSRTDMVVLSACQTGLGEVAGGEGVLGLQRAFQVAGARTVVASLWKVDDDATRALMTEFYRRLWNAKDRSAKLEALRQAQLAIRNHYRPAVQSPPANNSSSANNSGAAKNNPANRASPFYWAAFVLSGDWR
jgi:CHAT domain-containing protein/Tfp pilus assembly protein PilF